MGREKDGTSSFEEIGWDEDEKSEDEMATDKGPMLSINFHLTERCNMRCRYCFAQYALPEEGRSVPTLLQYHRIIDQIVAEGFSKISFAGGEPLLHPLLSQLVRHAKEKGLTTMLITNGSLLTPMTLEKMRGFLDWVSISIDSLREDRNRIIGRLWRGRGMTEADYRERVEYVRAANMRLKVNTVVSSENRDEILAPFIDSVCPERWKLFRALPLSGVNTKKAKDFFIDEATFQRFVDRNRGVSCHVVPESNKEMTDSYAMIDPWGRVYGNSQGRYTYSKPLYEVSLCTALKECGFRREKFLERGGEYDW